MTKGQLKFLLNVLFMMEKKLFLMKNYIKKSLKMECLKEQKQKQIKSNSICKKNTLIKNQQNLNI